MLAPFDVDVEYTARLLRRVQNAEDPCSSPLSKILRGDSRPSLVAGSVPSMLVEPKGRDSFKEIEEEMEGDPIKKSVGRMKPGVAKVWSGCLYFCLVCRSCC